MTTSIAQAIQHADPEFQESGDEIQDMEDDSIIGITRPGPIINRATAAKVPKKRAPANKDAANKRAPAKSTAKAKREALKDRTNIQDDSEEVEIFEDELDAVSALKVTKTKKNRAVQSDQEQDAPAKKKRVKATTKPAHAQDSLVPRQSSGTRKAPPKKRIQSVEPVHVIPETQQVLDVSESIEIEPEQMDVDQPLPRHVQRIVERARSVSQQRQAQHHVPTRARSVSQQPRHFSRGRSASESERRFADATSRRDLEEMTAKYEDLRLKYESLQELGKTGAETNFEKLKRASDQKAKDANELIASLKKEVSDLRKSNSSGTAENARMQTQVVFLQTEGEKQHAESKTLQASLVEAQNEVKSLTAKLEAARKSAATAAEAAKTPGSALKSRENNRTQLAGNLDATKQAAMREELYRDLTGLIINSIKRKDDEDEYSCIQTGRNGTLAFHLSIKNDVPTVNPKTPNSVSYDEVEFGYEPFFDEHRDRDLRDILPDYLIEEIAFPRNHATKFYAKIMECMTKQVVFEDDD